MERVLADENLLEEILLRLPPKTVLSFKPVSKRWCSLISSRTKICMFHQDVISLTTLLDPHVKASTKLEPQLLSAIYPFYQRLLKIEHGEIDFKILSSYNGLFLISLKSRNSKNVYYLVTNPLTKECHKLPGGKLTSRYELAFAPSKPCYYKVLAVAWKGYDIYLVQVYSSETNTWKATGDKVHFKFYEPSMSIIWNNCLLFVQQTQWKGRVGVFDLATLGVSYSSALLPTFNDVKEGTLVDYFGESGGYLYLVQEFEWSSDRKKNCRVWEIKGIGGSWKEKFQFKTERYGRTLYVYREGEQVWLLLLEACTVYYCLNGNRKGLVKAGDAPSYGWYGHTKWSTVPYTPTLFPLGSQ